MTEVEEFWHELVLCGIGGKTIDEAKRTLSYQEAQQWSRYRAKRGGLNFALRLEKQLSVFYKLYTDVHTKNGGFKIYDFTPFEDEPEITLKQAMEQWR